MIYYAYWRSAAKETTVASEEIEVVLGSQSTGDSAVIGSWQPVEGAEIQRMLERLPAAARDRVRTDAREILARCLPPAKGAARRAGLVVGQVQSGKTASFTAVAALARDNRIPLVILIAGTKTNLLEQSRARLAVDLGLNEEDAHLRWAPFKSPMPGSQDVSLMSHRLLDCLDSSSAHHVPVLITVMKNSTHMRRLALVLEQIGEQVGLRDITAIVIDDEVDQATPNLRWRAGSESATYRNLREIRDALPRHTLLEYTATPQAPLLVNLADEISPDFTYVLTPGDAYTGGRFFFLEKRERFVRLIPRNDLAAVDATHQEPPNSLFQALALFLLGVAAGMLTRKSGDPAQRSMLVHPSQATAPQAQFARWLRQALDQWLDIFNRSDDPDFSDWSEIYFEPAYRDLSQTIPNLPSREQLLNNLPRAMRFTRIEEVNTAAGASPAIEWSQAYSWILIGGAMMDRGFTVEGLTVTYMPRRVGVGNADTVQQRARFFGYKKSYAGYCRAWLSSEVDDVFRVYVDHEEHMRRALQEQAVSGQSLKQWRRRFLLDRALRPTRRAVISMFYSHQAWADSWFQQNHVPLPAAPESEPDIGLANSRLIERFAAGRHWVPDGAGLGLTAMQQHVSTFVPLADLLESVLADFAMLEEDGPNFASLMLGIEELADSKPDHAVRVVHMSRGAKRQRSLVADTTRIKRLFQGRSRDGRYPGDSHIHEGDKLTIQIHCVEPCADNGTDEGSEPQRSPVPMLAIYVPEALGFSSLVSAYHDDQIS